MTEEREGGRDGEKSPMAPERGEGRGGSYPMYKKRGNTGAMPQLCFTYLSQNSK